MTWMNEWMKHLFSALLCIAMAAGLNQDGNKMAYDQYVTQRCICPGK